MQRQGIEVKLETTVKTLSLQDGSATGVVLADGTHLASDLVVSDADPTYLYEHMIERAAQTTVVKLKQKAAHYSMGLFVLYFGTTRTYEEVAHHTIWMGERYRELLDDIFNKKILIKIRKCILSYESIAIDLNIKYFSNPVNQCCKCKIV